MQPEELLERARKAADQAKMLQQAVQRFGSEFEKRLLDALRRSAAGEVEQAFNKVMRKADKHDRKIREFPTLDRDKEVWICTTQAWDGKNYFLSTIQMEKKWGKCYAAKMSLEGVILLQVEQFRSKISELKAAILEGKLDEQIHLKAEHQIHSYLASRT